MFDACENAAECNVCGPRAIAEILECTAGSSLVSLQLLYHGASVKRCADDAQGLSCHSFDNVFNLSRFSRLRAITLDAELLLNGFGMRERSKCLAYLDPSAVKDYKARWALDEPSAHLAPTFAAMLPPSLEILRVRCTPAQLQRLESKTKQELLNSSGMNALPTLKEIVALSGTKGMEIASTKRLSERQGGVESAWYGDGVRIWPAAREASLVVPAQ